MCNVLRTRVDDDACQQAYPVNNKTHSELFIDPPVIFSWCQSLQSRAPTRSNLGPARPRMEMDKKVWM